MSDTPFTFLRRRRGAYRYLLTYLDGATVAVMEIDAGQRPKREPTRRVCVASVSHLDELEDVCDKWNAENDRQFGRHN